MTDLNFAGLGLPANLVAQLETAGFTTPTPIQAKAIPAQLEGRDVMGIAQTGSGKTAAFLLPILTGIAALSGRAMPLTARALILVPTRELAVQIEQVLRTLSKGMRVSTLLVLGGVSRSAQVNKLKQGVDVLIATPGRLCDLLDDKKVRLDHVRWLVLDEADRMLDMGFVKPVNDIARAVGSNRKTALFSATMAPEVAKLAQNLLSDPVRFEVAPQGSTVEKVTQNVVHVHMRNKRSALNHLLADDELKSVVIFARTKHGADRVAKNLEMDGHKAAAIHGNKTQNARQAALNAFRKGDNRILVATDIVARGIDVPGITHVINYELPDDPENYVHRIGRTGRNGASGTAITMLDPSERSKMRFVERLIRRTVPEMKLSGDTAWAPIADDASADVDRPQRQQRRGRPNGGQGKPRGKFNGEGRNAARAERRDGKPQGEGRERNGFGENRDRSKGADSAGDRPRSAAPGNKNKRPRWSKGKKVAAQANRAGGRPNRQGAVA